MVNSMKANKTQIKLATIKMRDINKRLQPINIIEKSLKQKLTKIIREIMNERVEKYERESIEEAKRIIKRKDEMNSKLLRTKRAEREITILREKEGKKLSSKDEMRREKILKRMKKQENELRMIGEEGIKKAISMEEYLNEKKKQWEKEDKSKAEEIKKLKSKRDKIVCKISRKFYERSISTLEESKKEEERRMRRVSRIYKNMIQELRNPNGRYIKSIINDDKEINQNCDICINVGNYYIDQKAQGKNTNELTKRVLKFCHQTSNERMCLESYMRIQIVEMNNGLPASGRQLCKTIDFCAK
jgi:hypothetical protein